MKNKIFSNSVYLLADFAAITILSFTFWFILGRLLTPTETGIVFTSWGISTILSVIITFGIHAALFKLISEKRTERHIISFTQISFKYVVLSSSITFVVMILLSQYFYSLFSFTFLITLVTALNTALLPLTYLSSSVLGGLQNMRKTFTTDLFGYVIKPITVLIFIFIGLRSSGPIISLFLAFLIIFLLRAKISWFSFKENKVLRSELLKYSFPAFLASIAAIAFSNIQYIILTILKNPAATGIFGYAMLVSSPLDLIPITIGAAALPIISNLSSSDDRKTQGYLLNLVVRYSLLIVLPLAVFLSYFSRQFFQIFFPQYVSATSLLTYLIPGTIFFGIASIFNSSIYVVKKPKTSRNITIFTTILFLIFAIPLTQRFSSQGIAAAFLISTFCMLLISTYYIKKFIGLKIHVVSFMKLFFAAALFFGFLLASDFISTSLIFKILLIIFGTVIYGMILLLLKFYIKEDVRVLKAIERRSPFLKKQIHFFVDFLERRI